MKLNKSRGVLWFAAALLIVAAGGRGAQIQLARSEIVIDFKDEGYYKTIPFIALQGDLFFICDNATHRILEYRLDGNKLEFLRAIGRPGQGPGDLMRPTDISVSGETLAVHDEFGISLFGLDGAFKSKFPLLSKSETMLFTAGRVFSVNHDSGKKDLIQSFDVSGRISNAFLAKSSLYSLRPEIHRGFTPDSLERTVFAGVLLFSEGKFFYLNKRFGDVFQSDASGANAVKRNLVSLLSKVEKAKADENRRMFLEEGYDLDKNRRMIPHNYLFDDAQIWNGRLFLLMENFDIIEKKPRPFTEIVEIDLASWTVAHTYRANAVAEFEFAFRFLIVEENKRPAFLMNIQTSGEDARLCLFRQER